MTFKGAPPRDHLVEHDAKCPDVGAAIHRFAARLLRAHVSSGPHNHPAHRHCGRGDGRGVFGGTKVPPFWHAIDGFGEAEIQHFHGAVWPNLYVGGLEVAMDDGLFVRGFERLGDLPRKRQGVGHRNGAARNDR